jgi:hypothetical protein
VTARPRTGRRRSARLDGGKGGNFLILPPGHDKPVPNGYFVYRSGTNVFVFLRSVYQDRTI